VDAGVSLASVSGGGGDSLSAPGFARRRRGGAALFDEVALYDRAFLGAEVADHLAVVADVAVRSGAPAPK
jgi:hypothetical protein